MNKKKKLLAIILSVVLGAGAIFGIAVAVKKTTGGGRILVVEAANFNYGGYYGGMEDMEGIVTTDISQDVYVGSSDTIEKVMVKEGDQVKEGQVLIRYDRTKTSLALQREELSYEQLKLNIEVAERNIETLRRISPYSEDYGGGEEIFPEPQPGEETAAVVYSELNQSSAPYNDDEEDAGTEMNPLRFLCAPDCVVTPAFLRAMKGAASEGPLYFTLEVRDGNTRDGALVKGFTFEASQLPDVPDAWSGRLFLQEVLKESTLVELYGEQAAKTNLAGIGDAYNAGDTSGTVGSSENPYRFLVKDGTTISKSFIDALKAKNNAYFVLESRSGNMLSGSLESMFYQGSGKVVLEGSWTGTVNLSDHSKPVIIVTGVEPTPTPSETPAPSPTGTPTGSPTPTPSGTPTDTPTPTAEPTDTPTPTTEPTDTPTPTTEPTDTPTPAPDPTDTPTPSIPPATNDDDNNNSGNAVNTAATGNSGSFVKVSGRFAQTTVLAGPSGSITDGAKFTKVAFGGGGDGGSNGYDLSSVGLISPNAQYSKEELAQARKDAEDTLRDYQLDLREAELRLKDAKIADEQGEVKAKMDGVVKHVGDPENPMADGSAFISVTGSGGQYVRCGLSELLLDEIHEGDPVMVMSWETGMSYQAVIKEISPYPDNSGMFGWGDSTVTYYPFTAQILDESAQLPNNSWVQVSVMKGGSGMEDDDMMAGEEGMTEDGMMTGEEGEFYEEEEDSDFYLWKAFIREENNKKYVFKEDADGKLVKQEIKVGKLNGEGYLIISGVSRSDWIAFPYGKGVKEGAKTRHGSPDELYGM